MNATTIVLGDLHANAAALRRALELGTRLAAAADAGPARWVVLGDLLTYGLDVDEVLDEVESLCERTGAVVLRGNHDQLYFDLAAGDRTYYDTLPDWIRESIDATYARLDAARFAARFAWRSEHVVGDVLYSHASPFGPDDWRYLSTQVEFAAATRKLTERQFRIGVFGHVHRHRCLVTSSDGAERFGAGDVEIAATDRAVLTAGSVGQPRDRGAAGSFVMIRTHADVHHVERVEIDYDVDAHLRTVTASTLSDATKARLARFFTGS